MLAHAAPLLLLVWKGQKSTKSSPGFGALRAMLSEEQVQTEATFLHGQGACLHKSHQAMAPQSCHTALNAYTPPHFPQPLVRYRTAEC